MAQRKIMVTDEGKFVVQVADQQSWEDYQRKQQNRLVNGADAIWQKGHFQDLPESLTCPLTGGLLRNPVKTSKCCNKLFSKTAIEDTLVENDFVCPECGKEDILLDSLVADSEAEKLVQEFLESHKDQNNVDKEDSHLDKKQKISEKPMMPPMPPMPVPPVPFPPFPMFPMPFMPAPAPVPVPAPAPPSLNSKPTAEVPNSTTKE